MNLSSWDFKSKLATPFIPIECQSNPALTGGKTDRGARDVEAAAVAEGRAGRGRQKNGRH